MDKDGYFGPSDEEGAEVCRCGHILFSHEYGADWFNARCDECECPFFAYWPPLMFKKRR